MSGASLRASALRFSGPSFCVDARVLLLALAAVVMLLTRPVPVAAQASATTPVFVGVLDDFPDLQARALLLREPGRDIVLLRSTEATEEAVAMSLAVLDRVRADDPRPTQGQLIPIAGFALEKPLSRRERVRFGAALERLSRAPAAEIGSFGTGRWTRLR